MSVALLVLRVVVGAVVGGHGCQKLFGWFSGHGLTGTGSFFESIGLTPGIPFALLAGTAELAGGLLLGFGLFLPVACVLLVAVMTTAIATVHWKHGIWSSEGGFEYPLVIAATVFTVTATGPGSISLDDALGIDWTSLRWAIGATLVGALGALASVLCARLAQRPRPAHPHAA